MKFLFRLIQNIWQFFLVFIAIFVIMPLFTVYILPLFITGPSMVLAIIVIGMGRSISGAVLFFDYILSHLNSSFGTIGFIIAMILLIAFMRAIINVLSFITVNSYKFVFDYVDRKKNKGRLQ
ncbi:MAG: hypothetical protein ATN35_12925 [Epulopiscium sp. Nele67-Bin004]|nr:MAG: hypothetical protein ATN35_12925 [Epulopiscium sp. Nele67-Bin004]